MKKFLIIAAVLFFTTLFSSSTFAQDATGGSSKAADAKAQKVDYDQNIKIKKKPHPSVSRSCLQTSGVTRVRVTFDKSAKVTDVELIISSGCNGFDDNALRAAKKIKFTPAMKNGEAVTVTKLVEYAFSIGRRII
jgi:protein TonB